MVKQWRMSNIGVQKVNNRGQTSGLLLVVAHWLINAEAVLAN